MEKQIIRVGAVDYAKIERLLFKFLLAGLTVGMILGLVIMGIIFKISYDAQGQKYERMISTYKTQVSDLNTRTASLETSNKEEVHSVVEQYETREQWFHDKIAELNDQVTALTNTIEDMSTTRSDDSSLEFDTLQEYWYIISDAPKNSGLTLDHIRYSLEQCEKWNVNPHLMWAIYTYESKLNPHADNSKSSARGLGQVLESSARNIWEKVLGHGKGSYVHTMAYDPYVNIEITTCMIGRNLAIGTLENALQLYGDKSASYGPNVLMIAQDRGHIITDSNALYS